MEFGRSSAKLEEAGLEEAGLEEAGLWRDDEDPALDEILGSDWNPFDELVLRNSIKDLKKEDKLKIFSRG